MATLLLRIQNGKPLTNKQVDDNFKAINDQIEGHVTLGNINNPAISHPVATVSNAGFMSAADKVSLNTVVSKTANASTAVAGITRYATTGESKDSAVTDRAVTPAGLAAALVSATVASIDTGAWTISETAGVLLFAYNGTNKASLDQHGNLRLVGTLTSGYATL